ncbi:MAG: SUMF1/EgtB/PvdO family nonheme iron enzyme [Planctomycetota bacterium]|jgi:formylglycine-generating enzyme required for sulfatase activity
MQRQVVTNLLMFLRVLAFCCPLFIYQTARSADVSYYLKKSTWPETMRLSREALIEQERNQGQQDPIVPFISDIIQGGTPARHIKVNVSGAKELFLFVTGVPDTVCGAANWADAKLIAKDGRETILGGPHLKVLAGRISIHRNLDSGVSGPLLIAGRKFDRGIHVYANSKIRIPLDYKYQWFEAWMGIDDWVGKNGHVRFSAGGADWAARMDLWNLVKRDFPEEEQRRQIGWEFQDRIWEQDWPVGNFSELAGRYAKASFRVPTLTERAAKLASAVSDRAGLHKVRRMYYRSRTMDQVLTRARTLNFRALRMAVEDLNKTFGTRYAKGPEYLSRLRTLEQDLAKANRHEPNELERITVLVDDFKELQSEALLDNPLLNFDRLLLIKRKPIGDPRRSIWAERGLGQYIGLPRQSSWTIATIPKPLDWDNEIAVLAPVRPNGKLTTLYKPDERKLITDVDLHFDAHKMLFTMPGSHRRWQIFEIDTDGTGLRQITPGEHPDVDNYDACYLPNGKIAFISTATFQGVPCNANVIVGMMYLMDADGRNIRQLCFEQDHDYTPSVLNDGRILYLRWEYTDTPHVWNRILFSMNPDGTDQREYYGASSYWPNAIFFARAIPDHPSKVVGIVTGHHEGRVGELVIFDPDKGQRENDGVVQRIPGYGQKVEPLIEDKLTEHSWPKCLHPYPLSEKYFLVSCKPTPDALWGIYLADVFDNMVLIKELDGHVLLEPIPLTKQPTPPVIQDRVQLDRKDAIVNMMDVYQGPGMAGVPRGAVKNLRVFTYHFGYRRIAGIDHRVGADGPWEVKRVLGTIPVEEDGSAMFRVPANIPFSVQPLDAEGKALQLMRSWATAMPGEVLSCVGCHERRNTAPPNRRTMAATKPLREITPWRGPTRGFSFKREVQPVLDKYCVNCHNGKTHSSPTIVDLRANQGGYMVYQHGNPQLKMVRGVPQEDLIKKHGGVFEPSYVALRRYLRVGGLESDLHLLGPMEFHPDTSELVQMLSKGHYNVELDDEAWDRLLTWIDLNAPCHGTWKELTTIRGNQQQRRCQLRKMYAGIDDNYEHIPEIETDPIQPVIPQALPAVDVRTVECPDWPFNPAEAQRRQSQTGHVARTIDLGNGVNMELVKIPAGSFVMGDPEGEVDEYPCTVVEIDRPFWMGKYEVTNQQYQQFDPAHDSRFEHRGSWIFSEEYLGWPVNHPQQPVVRVSWNQATAFGHWLSEKLGETVSLPTEAQWEYACRAGSATAMSYGGPDTDFSLFANLADYSIRELAYGSWRPKPPDLVPRDDRFNDRALVTAKVGSYRPNPWNLYDMHGNAAEWTRTTYTPYPYSDRDGRNGLNSQGKKVVRGGSWYDRPQRCRSSFRLSYRPYQPVYNVGFRIIISEL